MEKKNYLLIGLFALIMVGLSSCGKDPGDEVDPGLKGKMEQLTPSAAKENLQNTGVEFLDAISAQDHENLVEVIAFLSEEFAGYDIDEDYYDKLEDLYEEVIPEDEEYAIEKRVNPIAALQGLLEVSLNAAQNGAQLSTRADDIYMLTVQAGLKDLYGGFKPSKGEWRYDEDITDRLEVEFTDDHNRTWVATLKGSEKTTRIHMTEEYEYRYKQINENSYYDTPFTSGDEDHEKVDISIDVPKNITFVVKCGKETIIDMTVDSELDAEYDVYASEDVYYKYVDYELDKYEGDYELKLSVDYKELSVDAKLNVNGYEETWTANSDKKGSSTAAEVKIDGTSMLKYEASAKLDMDAFVEQVNRLGNYSESADDEDEYYGLDDDVQEIDPSFLGGFSMYLDVMGKVQVVASCESFEQLFNALEITEDEMEDFEDLSERKAFEKYIDGINETYTITVHYDKTKTVQANIEFEGVIDEYEDYYEEYTYYYVVPVLVFANDDSRYTFDEYFRERDFDDVIDAAEKLAEEFSEMFNEYF